MKEISANGLNLIKLFEGFRTEAYDDGGGIQTIGYGTIRYPDGTKVKAGDTCTAQEAETYLKHDVSGATAAVNNLAGHLPLTQNQFDSLVSFQYNTGGLPGSTLLKKILVNPADETVFKYDEESPVDSCEFLRWVRDNKKVVSGLINRRKEEADLYAEV
jgi:lysozyme